LIGSYPNIVIAAETGFADMSLKELMALDTFEAASLIPTQISKAPGTVYSFSRDDFSRYGARRVDELLQFIPGMQLNQYRKRHQSVWARGMLDRYNDKMVLMVDGVRLRHLYYGHFSLGDNFPLEKIEKVEVIMGPASSLYGANAFAGIISITTRNFSEGNEFEASLEVGNNDRAKATGLYNSDNFQIFASHVGQDAPFDKDRKSFIGQDALQPLAEHYSNVFIKASPFNGLTVFADFYESETPFVFIPSTQDAFVEQQMLNLAMSYDFGDTEHGRFETDVYYTSDNGREYELEQATQSLGYQENQDATMSGFNINYLKQFGDHVVALGGAITKESAENFEYTRLFSFSRGFSPTVQTGNLLSIPDIDNTDRALFLQDVWTVNDALQLTFGARYDDFERFGEHINYRGALVYTPSVHQTFKLLYGTAIRTPSFREYLKVSESLSFITPVPEPEKIKSVEISYLYQWENTNISLSAYHNEIDGYIIEFPTPDGVDEFFNNVNTVVDLNGIESVVNFQPTDKLNFRLTAAYLEAATDLTDTIPYLATLSASFNTDYNYYSDHLIGFSVVYNDERDDLNDVKEDNAESFFMAKVFGSGSLTNSLGYAFGIDNLFNEEIFDPAADYGRQYNTIKAEREIWVGLQWDFAY
jgi:outer membrane receptor for ferrienterochelin and colicin